ncbi:unnamed protein product [Cylicocyclus nassatus]|uniref:Uncharacterized protein n=1 Tax=Cylicocyclus nassatus TaxID=53992 RepID=A0AA36M3C1_CYLNA|nr:unnamed protein product [Cylicocyclus nassatus]
MDETGLARLLGIYGGTCFLVYVETSGFTKTQGLIDSLPLAMLSFLALTSNMAVKPRFTTAAAFATLALSRYLIVSKSSYELSVIGYILVVIGHLLYFSTFQSLIDEWSIALSMLGTTYFATLSYHCFADLFDSIPFLVLLHACVFASSCFLVVAAGSVCEQNADQDDVIAQASYMRLIGTLLNCSSNTIFLLSLFALRIETLQIFSQCLLYLADGLMYLANERTF